MTVRQQFDRFARIGPLRSSPSGVLTTFIAPISGLRTRWDYQSASGSNEGWCIEGVKADLHCNDRVTCSPKFDSPDIHDPPLTRLNIALSHVLAQCHKAWHRSHGAISARVMSSLSARNPQAFQLSVCFDPELQDLLPNGCALSSILHRIDMKLQLHGTHPCERTDGAGRKPSFQDLVH